MKSFVILISFAILTGCGVQKYSIAVPYLVPKIEAKHFQDSLLRNGVDTVVSYLSACSGCISGLPSSCYVYWIKNGERHLTKFTEEANYNTLIHITFPISFIDSNLDNIKNNLLIEPESKLLHGHYEEVSIRLGTKSIQYRMDEYQKANNPINYKVLVVDKIRSTLFEVSDREWNGKNFKYTKKRATPLK